MRPLDCLIQIRVLKDKQRRLSAGLKGDVLKVDARHLHDRPRRVRGSGERNLVDTEVTRDGRARVLAQAIQDINHARREAGLLDQITKHESAQRRLLGRLQHHSITARQRRPQLPRRHGQREVPGNDLPAHANGLAQRVR